MADLILNDPYAHERKTLTKEEQMEIFTRFLNHPAIVNDRYPYFWENVFYNLKSQKHLIIDDELQHKLWRQAFAKAKLSSEEYKKGVAVFNKLTEKWGKEKLPTRSQ